MKLRGASAFPSASASGAASFVGTCGVGAGVLDGAPCRDVERPSTGGSGLAAGGGGVVGGLIGVVVGVVAAATGGGAGRRLGRRRRRPWVSRPREASP